MAQSEQNVNCYAGGGEKCDPKTFLSDPFPREFGWALTPLFRIVIGAAPKLISSYPALLSDGLLAS